MSVIIKPYLDLDIIHTIGDNIYIEFTRQTTEGVVVNITNYTYITTIYLDGVTVDTIPTTVIDGTNGIFKIAEVPANLTWMSNKEYCYTIKETNSANISTTIFKGKFICENVYNNQI